VPILAKILMDRNNPNRAGAAMLLGEIGPAARAAAPALANVLREEFSYTRVKAEEALRQIQAMKPE
jgi:HEAT repeat protein